MAPPFPNNFDPLAQQRRIMQQVIPKNPLADFNRTIKQVTAADPLARQRQVMEKVAPQKPLFDFSQVVKPVVAPDPLARQRQLMEVVAKKPLAEYSRMIDKLMAPPDPLAQQRRVMEKIFPKDPFAEYRRIVDSFFEATGGTVQPAPVPAPEGASFDPTEVPAFALPDWALIFHLLTIAWLCHWLIADGVNVERLGALMIDAVALAHHLSKSE
jgi:hypothetical protein